VATNVVRYWQCYLSTWECQRRFERFSGSIIFLCAYLVFGRFFANIIVLRDSANRRWAFDNVIFLRDSAIQRCERFPVNVIFWRDGPLSLWAFCRQCYLDDHMKCGMISRWVYTSSSSVIHISHLKIYFLDSRPRRTRYGLLGSSTLEPLIVNYPIPPQNPSLNNYLCALSLSYKKQKKIPFQKLPLFFAEHKRGWAQIIFVELWSVSRPRLAEMAIEIWVMCQLTEKLFETSSVRWNLQVRIFVQILGDISISEISESENKNRLALSRKRSDILNIWQ